MPVADKTTVVEYNVYRICIGNSVISSDIWHKYHEWYFEIVIRNLTQFWNIRSGIYAKYQDKSCYYLFILLTAKGL